MREMVNVQPLPWHPEQYRATSWGVYDANDVLVTATLTREEAEFVCAAVNHFDELRDALVTLLDAFESFAGDANWGASSLGADTIRKANEVPDTVRTLLARIGVKGDR